MSGGELDFASREPALGSDGKGDGEEPRQHARSRRGIGTGRQNKFDVSRNSLKAGFKRGDCPNEGHDIAAALFSRRAGNVGETGQTFFQAFPGKLRHAAFGRHEDNFRNAGFNSFFDDPVRFFRCNEALKERYRQGRLCCAVRAVL